MALRQSAQPSSGYDTGIHGGQGFTTDTHVMVSAQQFIDHVGQVMTAEVDKLMANLENLNPRTWDGDAYRQFVTAKDNWHGAHGEIKNALIAIEGMLAESSKRYDQSDMDSQYGITNAVSGLDYRI